MILATRMKLVSVHMATFSPIFEMKVETSLFTRENCENFSIFFV